ncbi:DUF2953 domain-containing protein [Terrisporobacter petrolearius]|uniref:DUF2953 domain-containing protein n=1 Tax=Terrisporobacter petrolearius TaxID=1460447 RepID=UPI00292F0F83|nr:DUF2953 domain-containing protein [Terrisporobacter petrolearius]
MRYFNLKYICISIFFILILLLISYSHFIFSIDFNNKKIVVKLKVKLLFKLIRFNIQLYPSKKNKKKKRGSLKDLKILDKEFGNILNLVKKVKIIELYSNIYFSNVNPYVTIYINALINGIYGNITNICKCEKIYLNIVPKFNENNIKGSVKIHIKFRLNTMFKSIPILIRIIKLKSKEGGKNDSYKFNTKHYGDNS